MLLADEAPSKCLGKVAGLHDVLANVEVQR